MSRARRVLLFTAAGVLVTPALYLLGVLFSGGGHSYTAMILLFPLPGVVNFIFAPPNWLYLCVAALQYPLYSLLLATPHNRRQFYVTLSVLFLIHIMTVMACFKLDPRVSYKVPLQEPSLVYNQPLMPLKQVTSGFYMK